jgi:6-phosphogluconolactonase (cycloisomerase 2 family)
LRYPGKLFFILVALVSGPIFNCEADEVPRFAFAVNSFNNSISQFGVDGSAGTLIPNGFAAVNQFPSAIAVHPSNKYVFAIAQSVSQLQVYFLDDATGRLHEIADSPLATGLASPFALAFDPSGRYVYLAGRVSNNIMGYEFDAQSAKLQPIKTMPVPTGGQRARQLAMHPSGRFMYSVNVYSDTVSGFKVNPKSGVLTPVKGSPFWVGRAPVNIVAPMADIPEGITQGPYNIRIHPSGDYVFVCNWMSASVSAFKVDQTSGELTLVEGSPFESDPHPYDLIVSPDGRYLYSAHWVLDSIVSFEINPDSGQLKRLKSADMITLGQGPVDMWFDQSANALYVSHYFTHNIARFRYEPNTGALTPTDSTPGRPGPRSFGISYGSEKVGFSSNYLYGISTKHRSLFAYKIDKRTGDLQAAATVKLDAVPVALAHDKINNLVYVVTNNPDQIHAFSLQNGKTFQAQTQAPVSVKETPSSVAVGPNGLVVYVTSAKHDRMLIFERHPETGEIKEWPESPRTTESYPTDVKIDPAGRYAFVLNEKSNVISSYRYRSGLWPFVDRVEMNRKFTADNGQLSAITTDPLGNFMYAADGNNDQILVYAINPNTGIFEDAKEPSYKVGKNPQDISFHPSGKWAYVVNTKGATINTFAVDSLHGKIEKKLQTLKTARSPMRIIVDASGRFVYVMYNSSKKISVYSIDPVAGLLSHKTDVKQGVEIANIIIDSVID